jgi:cell volume regulation protein A
MAGTLTFGGEVLLGTIANLYGFVVTEAERRLTLADFVLAKLSRTPVLRERIEFHDRELVIQGMAGERINRIGLPLEPRQR